MQPEVSTTLTSVILLGLLSSFLYIVGEANVYADSRLIYATVVASISAFFSIIFVLPFTYTFLAFPMDFILFIMALVAFCLLEVLTGVQTCNSVWYLNYWGFYWGGFWTRPNFIVTGPGDIDWAGCSSWRAVLAWTFILSMLFLISSILGGFVIVAYRQEKKDARTIAKGLPTAKVEPIGHEGQESRNGSSVPSHI